MVQVGIATRDKSGRVAFTAVQRFNCGWLAPVAEAIGVLCGLAQALECSYDNVEGETDCLQITNLLRDKDTPRTNLGKIIEDILLLASSFNSVSWSYVPRESNSL